MGWREETRSVGFSVQVAMTKTEANLDSFS